MTGFMNESITAVSMLEGPTAMQELVSESSISSDDMKFKTIRNHYQHSEDQSMTYSQSMSMEGPWTGSSTSAPDLYPVNPDSQFLNRE
ncbi:hypothetical protein IFM89_013683 [Coptis chinensis]|uniref:Uncharacterized protein n=1 Tax=Coptis chinensis TaxID=261450 RepID=A0A835IQV8_9MAGN|nr:hypothetical protein IFM89_013683 [Coptis chinensis]